ncbi:MAG: polysaccharide deacetylase, partial [Proteobacteria bacterium]|nr:polysaccharide deacetylase [Pseudomonadota bacterium]
DSLDLLKEAGYLYMMDWPVDDQPFWFRTRNGPILSVPYPSEANDSLAMITRRESVRDWTENVIDNFDEMLRQSERQPLVMGVALHTHVLGQPFRLKGLRRVIEHVVRYRDRIWLARPGEIADYVATLPRGTVPGDAERG